MQLARWLVPSLVPAILFAWVANRTDREREPPLVLAGTFALAALLALAARFVEHKAMAFTGLDATVSPAGEAGSVAFLFLFVAPLRELTKVLAAWPGFRSRHFDEPYDGMVYAWVASLGFAAAQNAMMLRAHPQGAVWLARALLALPAHVFFASAWGYALGRARQEKRPGAIFPGAWLLATIAHGLYTHFVYGRGPGALVFGALPLLAAMGLVTLVAARDLRLRGDRPSRLPEDRLSRPSMWNVAAPPSLGTVREALRRADHPIMVRWIVFGAFVTIGAMIAFVASSVIVGHWAHLDFSLVDERDVTTAGPVALLGAGLLFAFPVSGFLVARASGLPTLLEPALASALAIVTTLVVLGLAAPVALVFGLAFSPILWGLACAGAWVGRPAR